MAAPPIPVKMLLVAFAAPTCPAAVAAPALVVLAASCVPVVALRVLAALTAVCPVPLSAASPLYCVLRRVLRVPKFVVYMSRRLWRR